MSVERDHSAFDGRSAGQWVDALCREGTVDKGSGAPIAPTLGKRRVGWSPRVPEASPLLDAVVTDRKPVADGVIELTIERVDGGALPSWDPGAHIDLVLAPTMIRQYSLLGDPADRRCWRIAVLLEEAGRGGSAHVHRHLRPGARLQVSHPRNDFPLVEAPAYLFVAGGIGITPILPMVRAVAASGGGWTLCYGGRTRRSMAYLGELPASAGKVLIRPQDECGLLPLEKLVAAATDGTAVYCCGPEPLLAAAARLCALRPALALHVERFAPAAADGRAEKTIEVELASSGVTVVVEPGRSILEALEEAGVAVLSSCRTGICGTCETGVADGVPEHRDSVLTEQERQANDLMMICVSRASSHRLVLDL